VGDAHASHSEAAAANKMNFLESLAKQFAGKPIDWDELEETLIRADRTIG